ncbi:MAG: hypothetical protein IT169_04600 [Bryobacterales bacterium]|nr:hypothetical protein [Bryobacterales bacterium]
MMRFVLPIRLAPRSSAVSQCCVVALHAFSRMPAALMLAAVLLRLATPVLAQPEGFQPPPMRKLTVPDGGREVSLALETSEPLKKGDEIVIKFAPSKVALRIVLPSGIEIGPDTAGEQGFVWRTFTPERPFGEAGSEGVLIEAAEKQPAGLYMLVVRESRRATELEAAIHIYPAPPPWEVEHEEMMRQIPGVHYLQPVTVPPGTKDFTLRVPLEEGTNFGFLQIVAPNRGVKIRLETPDGKIHDESVGKGGAVSWGVMEGLPSENEGEYDPWALINPYALLLPFRGIHHLVAFEKAEKGVYQVHADTTAVTEAATIRVLYLPIVDLLERTSDPFDPSVPPPPDKVSMDVSTPDGEIPAGVPFAITARIHGPAQPETVRLSAEMELRPLVDSSEAGRRMFGAPVTQFLNLEFRKTADQQYTAMYTPEVEGDLRFLVRAEGMRTDGSRFETLRISSSSAVYTPSARLLGIREEAVDENADGFPERLDLHFDLYVLEGGNFEAECELTAGLDERENRLPLLCRAQTNLLKGRQTLTASLRIDALARRTASDGPYTLQSLRIVRKDVSGYVNFLDTRNANLVTKAYPRANWRPAPGAANQRLEWQVEDRIGTGMAQVLQMDWTVYSPGGRCRWWGTLTREAGSPRLALPPMEADLPQGDVILPFDLLANHFVSFGVATWRVAPFLDCEASTMRVDIPPSTAPSVWIDPDVFEPLTRGIVMRRVPAVTIGQTQSARVELLFDAGAQRPVSGRITIAAAPASLECTVDDLALLPSDGSPSKAWLTLTPRAGLSAGSYHVVIAAEADGIRSTAKVRVVVTNSAP